MKLSLQLISAVIGVWLLGGVSGVSSVFADEPAPAMELRWGKTVELNAADQRELCAQLVQLVESSNFNSTMPNFAQLMDIDKYRDVLAGNHLTVTFPHTRVIKTLGGNVSLTKIIVGLDGPGYADGLFTVDDTGGVAAHGKYQGVLCIKLLDTIKLRTAR